MDNADVTERPRRRGSLLFDVNGIDLTNPRFDRGAIEQYNPHRDKMALLDSVPWVSDDFNQGVAVWKVQPDEFWVSGHFPDRPMLPGVLQVEAGAQLACFMFNLRKGKQVLAAFLRIEDASFRTPVEPGDEFLVLCQGVRWNQRRFRCDIQGVVGDRVCFDARILGMQLDESGAEA